jgi:carbonic anhydrase
MKKTIQNLLMVAVGYLSLSPSFHVQAASGAVSYKYMGNDWAGLCATGKRQSPIDIPTEQVENLHSGHLHRFLEAATTTSSTSISANVGGLTISAPTTITSSCSQSSVAETCN